MSSTDPQRRRSATATPSPPKRKGKPTPFSSSRVMVSTKKADAALRALKERQKAMRRQESGRASEPQAEVSSTAKKDAGASPAAQDREPSRPVVHTLQQPDVVHDDGMAEQLAAVAAAVDAISRRLAAHSCAITSHPPAEDRPLHVATRTASLPCEAADHVVPAARSTSQATPHNNNSNGASGGLDATLGWLHTHGARNLDAQARIHAASGNLREVVDYLYEHGRRRGGDETPARANNRTADAIDRRDLEGDDDDDAYEQTAPRPMPRIIVLPTDYVSMPSVTPAPVFWWE